MFCDNCGKSNASGVVKCAYCGSDMPKITESTGFSDILIYKPAEVADDVSSFGYADSVNNDAKKVSEEEMKKGGNSASMIGVIAIVISLLILLYSVNLNKTANETFEKYQKETEMHLMELEKKIKKLEGSKGLENVITTDEASNNVSADEKSVIEAGTVINQVVELVPEESEEAGKVISDLGNCISTDFSRIVINGSN